MEMITLIVWIVLGGISYRMADNRNRSGLLWAAGSVLTIPIAIPFILYVIGEAKEDKDV